MSGPMQGLIGKKLGMTQVFDEAGRSIPVTVIEAGPCVVVQRKTSERDGYDAVQLGFSEQKESRVTRAQLERFKKAKVTPMRRLREFRLDNGDDAEVGATVKADIFEGVGLVDVTGITKGRGFQGVVKRHRMSGGRMTHGAGSKRRVGSIGQCSYPARVAKGKRMPGHMGHVRRTQQNLQVVRIDAEQNLLLVKGAIPGPTGALVAVKKSLKKAGKSE